MVFKYVFGILIFQLPKPGTSQYRPKKGHDEYFSVPVLDRLVSISTGLVPGPALCPGAGAAEISQETMYVLILLILLEFLLPNFVVLGQIKNNLLLSFLADLNLVISFKFD